MPRLSVFALIAFSSTASAQFVPGNLAVYRVGDGSATLSSAATAAFVEQFNTTGIGQAPINTIAISTTGANRLVNSGSATSEGFLTRSTDGLLLTFGGYDAALGTASIATSTAAAAPRVGGVLDGAGVQTVLSSNFGTNFSAGNLRSVAMDAGRAWGVGSNTGVVANVTGSNTVVSSNVTNIRVVNVFSQQLYFSTGSGTRGIYSVGTGTPTTGPETSVNIINTGGTSSPYAFQANTAGTIVYIADDRTFVDGGDGGGIQRWEWNGTAWARTYTLGTGFTGTGSGARGLTVDWSNPNAPIIYATTGHAAGNRLIRLEDAGASSTATTLATSGTNTAFRGVDQTLLPATWTRATSGNWIDANTSTSGFGNQFANWSVGLADGVNLAFQNVNSGASPLAINSNNNSTIASVSSITFTNGGYGGGSGGTQYTVSGNALTLNGTAATGSGVTNISGSTQTILMELTLGTPQTFNAANGTLQFDNLIHLGANNLTVTGASNTIINGSINGSGGLVKTGTGTLTLNNSNTFAGDLTINQGTVAVSNADNSTGAGSTILNNGGRLLGGSNLSGVVVNSGGRIAPGNSPGTLNTGFATWNGGGVYEWEIDNATGTAGTNWDLWNINGNNQFTINATAGNQFVIDIPDPQTVANFDPLQSYSWEFATFNGAIQGAGFDPNAFNVLFGGPFAGNGTFAVSQVGNGLFLNFTPNPVPEPATVMLIGAAGAVWFAVRRRKDRSASPCG